MPTRLSGDCQNLLKNLLKRNALERLGAERGFEEIRRHPWFKGVSWKQVYLKQEVPFQNFKVPELKDRSSRIDMDQLF